MRHDLLLALAQMGLALAGFSGIIAALQGDPRTWSVQEAGALRLLLECCFLVVFLALVPLLIADVASAAFAARLAAGVLAVVALAWMASGVVRMRRLRTRARRPRLFAVLAGGLLALSVAELGVAAGLLVQPVLYAGTLIWLLVFASVQFFASLQSSGLGMTGRDG